MPHKYSKQQRTELLSLVFKCDTFLEACSTFHTIYPDQPKPSTSTCSRLVQKYIETGSVRDRRTARIKPVAEGPLSDTVRRIVDSNRNISGRQLAKRLGISTSSVQRMLKDKAIERSKYAWLSFCQWFHLKLIEQTSLVGDILFSDEATFYLDRHLSSWDDGNPNHREDQSTCLVDGQRCPKLTVWCGLHNRTILGPYIFRKNLTSESYETLLNQVILTYCDQLPLTVYGRMYIQQNPVPYHCSAKVKQWLDMHFPNSWIGEDGPIEWPTRLPHLNPLNFGFWRYVKGHVYHSPSRTLQDLETRIVDSCSNVPLSVLEDVETAFIQRTLLF